MNYLKDQNIIKLFSILVPHIANGMVLFRQGLVDLSSDKKRIWNLCRPDVDDYKSGA